MSANHGPDFIWATFDENLSEQTCDVYAQTTAEGFVEPPLRYRRADLPPTDAEVMNHPKVKALVEALEKIADEASVPVHTWKNGINFKKLYEGWRKIATTRIDIARAALAAIQEAKP